MARPKKVLTPEELKIKRENLRTVLKQTETGLKEAKAAKAAADKALEEAKKTADKAVEAAAKAAAKAVKAASKTHAGAVKKADRAIAAAEAGTTKLLNQLTALSAPAAPAATV